VALVSTSKGITTGKKCEEQGLGGEVLFFVW
jgi:ribosomal protein S8